MNIGNRWKLAFFITIGILAAILISILLFFNFIGSDTNFHYTHNKQQAPNNHFTISTTKEKLNNLIAEKLREERAPYRVELTDEHVVFQSNIILFGKSIPLKMALTPALVNNGDVVLELENLSVSSVPVPREYILQLVSEFTQLPPWVTIYPEERLIHIVTEDIARERGLVFRFKTLDLDKDLIMLEMKVLFNR